MGSTFATVRAAVASTSFRPRARRSLRKVPRWLVFLVVLAVGSTTLALTDAPVSANTGECSTNTYEDAQQAKDNFINDCGASFQETPAFSCAWVDEGGWQCTGPGNRSATPSAPIETERNEQREARIEEPAQPVVATNTGECSTNTYGDAQQAKDNFINDCGAPFQESPAFSCAWVDEGGWQCSGPGGRQQPTQPVAPEPATAEPSPSVFIPTVQCTTSFYNTTQAAQDNFFNDCGAPFEDSPDFRCTRDREGAFCTGPTSAGQVPAGPIIEGQPVGSARETLGSYPGLTGEQRAERFAANIPVLEGLLEALPNPPEDTAQVQEVEDLAFEQAMLLLNIDPEDRGDLWGIWLRVNRGINPSFHADGVPIFTPFQESFNATGKTQRLEFYGFDEFGWSLAEPYIELSWDMYRTRHALEDPLAPLVQLFTIGVLSLITAGLASGAYAAWFGVSQTSFGAVTFGSVVSSYGTTLFTTRSTAQAEKAALLGALTAGISELTEIPLLSRPDHVKLSIALLEGGIASLNDGDFTRAFLLSLSEQYLPGVGSFIEQLDNTSPFLVDLGVELVGSYIEHDGEWELISADVERFFLDEAQEYVGDLIGDQLPESWGDFGDEFGELAGVAVTEGGDPVAIRAAVSARIGELAGLGVGSVLGNNDSIIAGITDQLVETWALAQDFDPEDRAAFIDGRLTNYVFGLAAEEISSFAGERLVSANGGESNALITSTVGLIDLAVSNAWRDSDELEDLLVGYVGNELQGVIRSQFPECAPAWAVGLGDQVVGIVIDRALTGEGGEIGDDVVNLFTNAAQTGQIDGTNVGTCGQTAGAGSAAGSGSSVTTPAPSASTFLDLDAGVSTSHDDLELNWHVLPTVDYTVLQLSLDSRGEPTVVTDITDLGFSRDTGQARTQRIPLPEETTFFLAYGTLDDQLVQLSGLAQYARDPAFDSPSNDFNAFRHDCASLCSIAEWAQEPGFEQVASGNSSAGVMYVGGPALFELLVAIGRVAIRSAGPVVREIGRVFMELCGPSFRPSKPTIDCNEVAAQLSDSDNPADVIFDRQVAIFDDNRNYLRVSSFDKDRQSFTCATDCDTELQGSLMGSVSATAVVEVRRSDPGDNGTVTTTTQEFNDRGQILFERKEVLIVTEGLSSTSARIDHDSTRRVETQWGYNAFTGEINFLNETTFLGGRIIDTNCISCSTS